MCAAGFPSPRSSPSPSPGWLNARSVRWSSRASTMPSPGWNSSPRPSPTPPIAGVAGHRCARAMGMDILVTGGNGLLGRHLIPQLQERGDAVRVLVLPGEDATWLEQRGVRVFRGDVRDKLTLFPTVNHADAVLNLAGMMGVWRPMADHRAVNVTGTENVCHAALAAGVKRLVHI